MPLNLSLFLIHQKLNKVLQLVAKRWVLFRAGLRALYVRLNPRSPDHVIWLLSAGRSGSTWVSSLLQSQLTYREVFEPFHPVQSHMPPTLTSHPYNPQTPEFAEFADLVFAGKYAQARTEVDNVGRPLSQNGLLIKDVFANLFCAQELDKRPEIDAILLMRNPADVVASKRLQPHWHWVWDPAEYLNDSALVNDHLSPLAETIATFSKRGSLEEKLLTSWCIQHLVPLRNCPPNRLRLAFYEEIKAHPQKEIRNLLRESAVLPSTQAPEQIERLIQAPSRLANAQKGRKSIVPREQVERVFDAMGLGGWLSDGRLSPSGVRSWWAAQHR